MSYAWRFQPYLKNTANKTADLPWGRNAVTVYLVVSVGLVLACSARGHASEYGHVTENLVANSPWLR